MTCSKDHYIKKSFICLLAFLSTFMLKTNVHASEYISDAVEVKTVINSGPSDSTTTVVEEQKLFNSSGTITISTQGAIQAEIESCILSQDSSLSIHYTASDITDWPGTIKALIQQAMDKPGNDYAKFIIKQYSYSYNGIGDVTFNFSYIETPGQTQFVKNKISEVLSTIIKASMTDEQKEKAINDYIVSNVAYDTTLVKHSAYAALVSPYKTVCQGYALFAYQMLTSAGFEARIIEGTAGAKKEAHAWNLVKLNGNWYHLDCTWNDPVPDVPYRVTYNYFNLTDSQIGTNHFWDKNKYVGYECNTIYVTSDKDILNKIGNTSSQVPLASNITIANNKVGIDDTVTVAGLTEGDVIRVYDNTKAKGGKLLGIASVATSSSIALVNISQIGSNAGTLYVSVTNSGRMESTYVSKKYDKEPVSKNLIAKNISVMNNREGVPDIITVKSLSDGDIVRIYDGPKITANLIGCSTSSSAIVTSSGAIQVTTSSALVTDGAVTLEITTPLSSKAGNVYVSVENKDKNESGRTVVPYKTDDSRPLIATKIITFNDEGDGNDIVRVIGLNLGDEILVYKSKDGTDILGRAVVQTSRHAVNVSLTLPDMPKSDKGVPLAKGTIYVSIIENGKKECTKRTAQTYIAQ